MDAYESARRILQRTPKTYTKEEATQRLQSLGVMCKNRTIKKEYRGVFVNNTTNEAKRD
ncbi:MAG: hypothetical protein IJQ45_05125 [Clostridia bacterium]|nr:hypothetical protein [Oscillospiraceae bacterium]MBQ6866871.1 hypothetical protein [Clostridia bacterium]MBR0206113.1 hypothetical protein [Clostridia bacterium]